MGFGSIILFLAGTTLVYSVENRKEFILCANNTATDGIDGSIPYEKCYNSFCFTLWQEDLNNDTIILRQGCWDVPSEQKDCERSRCLSDKKPSKALNNTKFCCCYGDKCNDNFTDIYVPSEEPPEPPQVAPRSNILYLVTGAVVCLILITILGIFLVIRLNRFKDIKGDVENQQQVLPPPAEYSLEKLKLLTVIGQGRYGTVWKGVIEDQEIAVKVFPAHHRNYFLNEQEMYQASGQNSALLRCFGGGGYRMVSDQPADYYLLLSLEQECLQEYLKNHTLDLGTLSRMSLGIAKGLAHLHSDLGKPCIVHRDVNTRNVLVRPDLSCCICDLGLAVIPRQAENRAISEAGTLRYMAPEVLEGAVNLRDCESALKQIDVYALGLVLWELGVRCVDMQNAEPQSYAPPFAKEAGENPTLEQMQGLVSRRKVRPLWPVSWKDTAAARLLCETAEDCWDQDAEARLTSLCVVERLLELPTLKGRVLHPMHPPASPTPLINNNHLRDRLDVSVGTIETLLSPSEEYTKNSNQLAACQTPLQPYQGRNPCLERNLMTGSSDSLLIDKSFKHCTSSEDQNLIGNDFLNQINVPRAMPIPYVQNAVHALPKQMNNEKPKFKWTLKRLFNNRKRGNGGCKETQVKLNSKVQNGVTTMLLGEEVRRPSSLALSVVKAHEGSNSGVTQLLKGKGRQSSLEQFNEVFSSTTDLSRLKDPSGRVKTPGDVPPSVRRTRGKAAADSARFSLYDDRMMGQWGSAPDLDPPVIVNPNEADRDSVSSF